MNSEINKTVIKIKDLINRYTKVSKQAISEFNESNTEEDCQTLICYLILKRLNSNSIAIGRILQDYLEEEDSDVEYSIGLLIRNCIADTITISYINWQGKDQNLPAKEMEDLAKSILGDQVMRTMDPFKNDLVQRNKLRNQFLALYPGLFEQDSDGNLSPKYTIRNVGTTNMGREIKNDFEKLIPNILDRWMWYSKYEHIGVLTLDIQKLPLQDRLGIVQLVLQEVIYAIRLISLNQQTKIRSYSEIEASLKKIAEGN